MSSRSQLSPLDGVESTFLKAPAFSTGHGMARDVACCAAAGALPRRCPAVKVTLVIAGMCCDDGGGFVTGGGASRCLSCP
jgi:hypothetical protein